MVAEADLAEPYGLLLSLPHPPNYFISIVEVESQWMKYKFSMMKCLVLREKT